MNKLESGLYIVTTPIGNLDDITLRALEVLKKSDIILCEDTRRSLKLLNHYKIKKKLISYHKFNEKKEINKIIKYLNEGKILSLISDAGTPLLSDPGRLLVNECVSKKINITPIPGVSAITTTMSVSGFKDNFIFNGFLPKTLNELKKILSQLENLNFSMVFFVPGNKINFYLNNFKSYFKDRKILIAREITKLHESFYREDVEKLSLFKTPLKGEITIVISEKKDINKNNFPHEEIRKQAIRYLKKYSVKDVVDLISQKEIVSKKRIYEICLDIKNEKNF